MRKIFFVLLAGMTLFIPESLYARTYSLVNVSNTVDSDFPSPTLTPHRPQMPAFHPILVDINEDSGDLGILFNQSIENVNITIKYNGVTIDEDNLSVLNGQCIIYNMYSYEVGQYTLTIESEGNTLSQYEIIIYEE
jgi:hypothetical protein